MGIKAMDERINRRKIINNPVRFFLLWIMIPGALIALVYWPDYDQNFVEHWMWITSSLANRIDRWIGMEQLGGYLTQTALVINAMVLILVILFIEWIIRYPGALIFSLVRGEEDPSTLVTAAEFGLGWRIKHLVDKGVDVNVKDNYGNTALSEAADRGYLWIVRLLADHGAYLDVKNYAGDVPLVMAARKGRLKIMKILVGNGAYINAKGDKNRTALSTVADMNLKMNRGKMVRYLVKNGADLKQKDTWGNTALQIALDAQNKSIAMYLLRQGANINAKSGSGTTPLRTAKSEGYTRIVKYMESKGARKWT